MTFTEARRFLGLHATAVLGENDIRKAYSAAVRLAHPDIGGGHGNEASNVGRLKEAKDLLLKIVADREEIFGTKCLQCKGTGQVRGTFATAVCRSCKGSGKDAHLSGR